MLNQSKCNEDIPDDRVEGVWRQILVGFRGAILADWYVDHALHGHEADS